MLFVATISLVIYVPVYNTSLPISNFQPFLVLRTFLFLDTLLRFLSRFYILLHRHNGLGL